LDSKCWPLIWNHRETEISDLGGRLAALRKDYAALEQESSGIEMQLSLKNAQHKESLALLQCELDALRGTPSLEARLQELQEKCDEMEEDLKEKCAEIERTDEKYLGYVVVIPFLTHSLTVSHCQSTQGTQKA
jgi:chromosome segregation ATPase